MGTSMSITDDLEKRFQNRRYKGKIVSGPAANIFQNPDKKQAQPQILSLEQQLMLTCNNENKSKVEQSLEQKTNIIIDKIQKKLSLVPHNQIQHLQKIEITQNKDQSLDPIKSSSQNINLNYSVSNRQSTDHLSGQRQSFVFAYLDQEAIQNFTRASEKRMQIINAKSKTFDNITQKQNNEKRQHLQTSEKIYVKNNKRIIKKLSISNGPKEQLQSPQSKIITKSKESLGKQQKQYNKYSIDKKIHLQQIGTVFNKPKIRRLKLKQQYKTQQVRRQNKNVNTRLTQYN